MAASSSFSHAARSAKCLRQRAVRFPLVVGLRAEARPRRRRDRWRLAGAAPAGEACAGPGAAARSARPRPTAWARARSRGAPIPEREQRLDGDVAPVEKRACGAERDLEVNSPADRRPGRTTCLTGAGLARPDALRNRHLRFRVLSDAAFVVEPGMRNASERRAPVHPRADDDLRGPRRPRIVRPSAILPSPMPPRPNGGSKSC